MKCIILESATNSEVTEVKPLGDGHGIEFTAVLQKADYKNRNGRIYPHDVLDEGIHSPIVQEKLKTKTLYGEAGHPLSTDVRRTTTIDLRNVAFIIEEMWWDGDLLKAKCKTASTAAGRDMAGLIQDGSVLSFSLRAQGNVMKDPNRDALVVQKPLAIIGWDWVWLPSNQDAYMTTDAVSGISEETQQMMYNYNGYSSRKMALDESMKLYEDGTMINMSKKEDEKKIIDYSTTYSKQLKPLEEMYVYDKNDVVKEMNDRYVILENGSVTKKVATKDYITKSLHGALKEDIVPGQVGNGLACVDEPVANPGVVVSDANDVITSVSDMMKKLGVTEAATEQANGNAKMLSDSGLDSAGDKDGVAVPASKDVHTDSDGNVTLPEGTLEVADHARDDA